MIDSIKNGYIGLINFASSLKSPFLLIVRLFWGYMFLKSGLGKVGNTDSVAGYFQGLNIPFPVLSAYLAGWTEVIGGAFLIIGFASRLIAIPLIFTMLVAFWTAHQAPLLAFFDKPSGILKESPFTYLFAAIVIFIFGPGKLSLDYFFEKLTKSKIE